MVRLTIRFWTEKIKETKMKTAKLIITILLVLGSLFAGDNKKQIQQAKEMIHKGLLEWNEGKFFQAANICERVYNSDQNPYAKYYQTFAQANILQKAMVEKKTEKFNNFYEAAINNAKELRESESFADEAEVLLAHITMSKLSVSPEEAPVLAGKFHSHIEKALGINPENPRALVLKAVMSFYTPEAFGGDVKKAIEIFEKAKPIFEKKNENSLTPEWGYLDLAAVLGMAYTKTGEFEKAKKIYQEVLEKEPNYGRIKFMLLPQLEKKIKERK